MDETKLKEMQQLLIEDAELIEKRYEPMYAEDFGEMLEPSRDTDVILERMRKKTSATRASMFRFACYCRGLVEKDDWPYWKEHWVPYEWASN